MWIWGQGRRGGHVQGRTYGHHPLGAWCDSTGEALALLLRPGNAGSNTAADHIMVLGEAIAQVPDPQRRDLLITVDGPAPPGN